MSNFTDYSPTADLVIGTVGIFLGGYTIIANTVVIAIISRFEKRTNSELVFANLAVTDVIGGLDAIFAFVILLAKRRYFDYYFVDDVICQMTAISWCIISISTPLMLSLTCLGRFLAIFTPHRYDSLFTRRNVIAAIAFFWLISTVGGTMHLYKLENTKMNPKWGYCDYRLINIYTAQQTRLIVVTLYCTPLAFSSLLLVFCNSAICVKLLQMRIRAKKRVCRRISVANGLQSALPINIAVADTTAARRLTRTEAEPELDPAKRVLDTNVFELELVLQDSLPSTFKYDSSSSGTTNINKRTSRRLIRPGRVQKYVSKNIRSIKKSVLGEPSSQSSAETSTKSTASEVAKRRKERARKERNIILVTVLFSLNFVVWNCIMLYYYFAYLVSPSTQVFKTIAGDSEVMDTYLNGWFYYATFMTSCVNPFIHFVCNSKMRSGFRHMISSCRC